MLTLVVVLSAACSGEPRGGDAGRPRADADKTVAAGSGGDADRSEQEGGGDDETAATSGRAGSSGGGSTSGGRTTPAGSATGGAEGSTAAAPAPTRASARPSVPRFAAREERVGMSDTTIRLCTHVNGQASAALGGTQDDTQVFWRWVNDQGGVHGRKIDMVIADDADGASVASAYEQCRGSFLIIGGPSQEAVPSFRKVVENDPRPAPYLHFMARSDPGSKHSFSWYPTQERYGALAADFVLKRHPGRRIGIIRRDTDNWTPGYETFVAELRRNGVEPVVAVKHPPKEQIFEPYLAELAAKKAEVVWAWNHGVEHIPMLKQASSRQYRFQWVLGFPLSVVAETLRDDLLEPQATGLGVFPAFRPGLYDEHHARYEKEGRLFEAAYQKYRGRPADPVFSDLLLRQWLDGRQLIDLLQRCGRDCTRTKAVTVLLDGLTHHAPACPFDFSLGRASGTSLSAVEAYAPNPTTVAWRETQHCVSSF